MINGNTICKEYFIDFFYIYIDDEILKFLTICFELLKYKIKILYIKNYKKYFIDYII
jgi:hypothetical protein